jgi:hypothetical protein
MTPFLPTHVYRCLSFVFDYYLKRASLGLLCTRFVYFTCLSAGKAWGVAGPPVRSIIGRAGGQIPD